VRRASVACPIAANAPPLGNGAHQIAVLSMTNNDEPWICPSPRFREFCTSGPSSRFLLRVASPFWGFRRLFLDKSLNVLLVDARADLCPPSPCTGSLRSWLGPWIFSSFMVCPFPLSAGNAWSSDSCRFLPEKKQLSLHNYGLGSERARPWRRLSFCEWKALSLARCTFGKISSCLEMRAEEHVQSWLCFHG